MTVMVETRDEEGGAVPNGLALYRTLHRVGSEKSLILCCLKPTRRYHHHVPVSGNRVLQKGAQSPPKSKKSDDTCS